MSWRTGRVSIALVIGAAAGAACVKQPNGPVEPYGAGWPDELPMENIGAVDCPTGRCFVVEENSRYCSIDPVAAQGGPFFATKSEVQLPAGVYPLDGEGIGDFPMEISSPVGSATLRPAGGDLLWEQSETIGADASRPAFSTRSPSPFEADGIAVEHATIVAPHIEFWQDRHFRLGDPEHAWWWQTGDRRLVLRFAGPSSILPQIREQETVFYAPCAFADVEPDVLTFQFEAGRLSFTLRTLSTTGGTGRVTMRLERVEGDYGGAVVSVTDRNLLAAYGSDDSAEVRMPTMVFRTPLDDGSCGVWLSAEDNWGPTADGAFQWQGWRARKVTCEDVLGENVDVIEASVPERYAIP